MTVIQFLTFILVVNGGGLSLFKLTTNTALRTIPIVEASSFSSMSPSITTATSTPSSTTSTESYAKFILLSTKMTPNANGIHLSITKAPPPVPLISKQPAKTTKTISNNKIENSHSMTSEFQQKRSEQSENGVDDKSDGISNLLAPSQQRLTLSSSPSSIVSHSDVMVTARTTFTTMAPKTSSFTTNSLSSSDVPANIFLTNRPNSNGTTTQSSANISMNVDITTINIPKSVDVVEAVAAEKQQNSVTDSTKLNNVESTTTTTMTKTKTTTDDKSRNVPNIGTAATNPTENENVTGIGKKSIEDNSILIENDDKSNDKIQTDATPSNVVQSEASPSNCLNALSISSKLVNDNTKMAITKMTKLPKIIDKTKILLNKEDNERPTISNCVHEQNVTTNITTAGILNNSEQHEITDAIEKTDSNSNGKIVTHRNTTNQYSIRSIQFQHILDDIKINEIVTLPNKIRSTTESLLSSSSFPPPTPSNRIAIQKNVTEAPAILNISSNFRNNQNKPKALPFNVTVEHRLNRNSGNHGEQHSNATTTTLVGSDYRNNAYQHVMMNKTAVNLIYARKSNETTMNATSTAAKDFDKLYRSRALNKLENFHSNNSMRNINNFDKNSSNIHNNDKRGKNGLTTVKNVIDATEITVINAQNVSNFDLFEINVSPNEPNERFAHKIENHKFVASSASKQSDQHSKQKIQMNKIETFHSTKPTSVQNYEKFQMGDNREQSVKYAPDKSRHQSNDLLRVKSTQTYTISFESINAGPDKTINVTAGNVYSNDKHRQQNERIYAAGGDSDTKLLQANEKMATNLPISQRSIDSFESNAKRMHTNDDGNSSARLTLPIIISTIATNLTISQSSMPLVEGNLTTVFATPSYADQNSDINWTFGPSSSGYGNLSLAPIIMRAATMPNTTHQQSHNNISNRSMTLLNHNSQDITTATTISNNDEHFNANPTNFRHQYITTMATTTAAPTRLNNGATIDTNTFINTDNVSLMLNDFHRNHIAIDDGHAVRKYINDILTVGLSAESNTNNQQFNIDYVNGTNGSNNSGNSHNASIVEAVDENALTWPVKHSAIVEGDVVLGGLMMVHSREDTITCGPIMPQGGIQALEVMLFTLDRINESGLLKNFSLGAHILDDCDKDTYGLEMAVDFIKGKRQQFSICFSQ